MTYYDWRVALKALTICLLIVMTTIPARGEEPYTCNMAALTAEDLAVYETLTETLLASIQEKKELKDGYAFRLPPEKLVDSAQWVSFERQCCPFFEFELEVAKDGGPVWLRITGGKAIKEFIRAEFQL